MMALLKKEIRLTASPLTWFFLCAVLLTLVPGYPILFGAFFVTLGIFQSYQTMGQNNDVAYSVLLPVSKASIVKGKLLFILLVEGIGFILMTALTLVRMTVLADAAVYTSNALMCANGTFLGFALLMFGLFNRVFFAGFFRTAYSFGKPFLIYCPVAVAVVLVAEILYHIPGLEGLNGFGFGHFGPQAIALALGALSFALLTFAALKRSIARFERIDL